VTNGRPPRDVVFLLAGAAVLYIAFWLAVRLRSLLVMLIAEFEGDRIRPRRGARPAAGAPTGWR
jgi:hypothetical protein